jgi:glycine hydroxymethyltransferase
MGEAEMAQVANWMADILETPEDAALRARIKDEVIALCDRFPIYAYMTREGEYI